jgi:aerobic carbon-monoxide dehydrogenase large subunit
VVRLEDAPLLTGQGAFVGDIGFPQQLYAHRALGLCECRAGAVNVAAALALPGVVAVWTAADIDDLPPIDFRDPTAEALRPYRQPLLARERLRYVGEPIAALASTLVVEFSGRSAV